MAINNNSVGTKKLCVLNPHTVKNIVEGYKQFILGIQNEAQINEKGVYEIRDLILKEISEHYHSISYIKQVCIENENYHVAHNINVSTICALIGTKIGLRPEELRSVTLAALIHDIGKLKLPYQVVLKPGRLTPKEFELYKLHVPLGYKILKDEIKIEPTVHRLVLEHHERADGTGYPKGLSSQDIHPLSQIIAVSDYYEDLTNSILNKEVSPPGEVVKELLSSTNKFFPQALHSLVHMIRFNR